MASKMNINVMWFRQDLRLADNPALSKSLEDGKTLPIFIFDNVDEGVVKSISISALFIISFALLDTINLELI